MKRVLLVLLVTGVWLTACAGPGPEVAQEPSSAPPAPVTAGASATAEPTDAGDPATPEALAWSASLVGGGQLDGATLAGGDVALWFWAPW